jgi:hypothetical protein
MLNVPNPSGRTRPWGSLSLYQKRVQETYLKKCFWEIKKKQKHASYLTLGHYLKFLNRNMNPILRLATI